MNRKTTWFATRLFLQFAGAMFLLAWVLFAGQNVVVKFLAAVATGFLFAVLYRILAALERRRVRKEIAERVCAVSFVRPPRWNNRAIEEYSLRGPAVRALMAEHNQTARNVELALRGLGYARKETRRAIKAGRYEHGMCSYEALLQFALKELSGEHEKIYRIGDVPAVQAEPANRAQQARAAGR